MIVAARPAIVGILNLTPDSFADGGRYQGLDLALQQARRMLVEGASVIDVGGESTRPGAVPVNAAEQVRRTLPLIEALAPELPAGARISIDTTRLEVARRAVAAGARLINDVSAGRDEPAILRLAAETGAAMVLMHGRGDPRLEQTPDCADPTAAVIGFLRQRIASALAAGLEPAALILDPGIGFGKTREQNLRLLRELPRLVALGHPVMLGASRKRFMGSICAGASPDDLLPATCASTALGVMAGVSLFRVHDVAANRQVADVVAAIRSAGAGAT